MNKDTETLNAAIGKKLLDLRKSRKMKQREVAAALGIERSTYAYYESGRHAPPLAVLIALAGFYDLSLDELAGKKDGGE